MAITGEFLSAIFGTPSEINVLEHLTNLNKRHLGARYGSAQLYDPKLRQLQLVANCGFRQGLLDQFDATPLSGKSVCARAAAMKAPVVASNIPTNPDWESIRAFSREAGFTGVLSYPIVSRTGELLGVTSCHFDDRAPLTTTELELVRLSCDFAADAIAELRFSERPRKSDWNAGDSLT
jgi:GAF domain-containing protein